MVGISEFRRRRLKYRVEVEFRRKRKPIPKHETQDKPLRLFKKTERSVNRMIDEPIYFYIN